MNTAATIASIMKYELKQQLKSIVFWIIVALLLIFLYSEIFPYIMYYPIKTESDLERLKEVGAYTDLMIEKSEKEVNEVIKEYLVGIVNANDTAKEDKDSVQTMLGKMAKEDMSLKDIEIYSKEKLSKYYNTIRVIISNKKYRDATLDEAKGKVNGALKLDRFSSYFARRFADRIGVFSVLIILFIFAFIFEKDRRDNINEIIYTRPVKAVEYVTGKYLGALFAYLLLLSFITIILDILVCYKSASMGWSFNFFDIIGYTFSWVFISIIFISVLITALSLILKSGIATIPVYLVYFIAIVKPVMAKSGEIIYPVGLTRFIIRWDGGFFDIESPERVSQIIQNRTFYSILAIVLLGVAVFAWNRFRTLKKGVFNNVYSSIFKSSKV